MSAPSTRTGRQLLELLPLVYRSRDRDEGDLGAYLDACGELLDRIRNTLDQKLADSFPEGEHAGRSAQSWLLPYFAQLLDVRLTSPHVEGRRAEVAHAVAWRQRKGTVASIESIAEEVAQLEAEVDEGWRRVAVTPRVDMPRLPAAAFGVAELPGAEDPLAAARHPALPTVTPDFRFASRAVETASGHPLARRTRFPGQTLTWRLAHRSGVPCFPGSYEDGSCRTADLRTPGWSRGHFHPRRVLVFVPPPSGFFTFGETRVSWADRADHVLETAAGSVRSISRGLPDSTVTFTSLPPTFGDAVTRIEGLNFLGRIRTGGRFELRGVAAARVVVTASDIDAPVLDAVDCLFGEVIVDNGLVRLEGCTVTSRLRAGRIQASDSILPDDAVLVGAAAGSCVRYSRLPAPLAALPDAVLRAPQSTTAAPVYFDFELCGAGGPDRSSVWGAPGHAVLHPATTEAICAGSEDGGEMGAYHHRKHCLQAQAVLTKLESFVPVGLEVGLIPDPRLLQAPPQAEPEG